MTTNVDRAAEVLWLLEPHQSTSERDYQQARELAQALADATPPLIMPDLPEPTNWTQEHYSNRPTWFDLDVTVKKGAVEFHHGGYANEENDEIYSPASARDLAYALLAAANHAEKNKE